MNAAKNDNEHGQSVWLRILAVLTIIALASAGLISIGEGEDPAAFPAFETSLAAGVGAMAVICWRFGRVIFFAVSGVLILWTLVSAALVLSAFM